MGCSAAPTYAQWAAAWEGRAAGGMAWDGRLLGHAPAVQRPGPHPAQAANLKLKAIKGLFGGFGGIQLDDTLGCWGDEKTSHLSVPAGFKVLIP